MTNFYIDQSVVYIDDFMPDTVEIITDMNAEQIIFNHGSRNCIPEMIRPAVYLEKILNKRIFSHEEINQPNVQEYFTSNIEPVLDAPARVGGTTFKTGINWSTVVGAAQRQFSYLQDEIKENKPDISLIKKILSNEYAIVPREITPLQAKYQAEVLFSKHEKLARAEHRDLNDDEFELIKARWIANKAISLRVEYQELIEVLGQKQ